MSILQIAIPVPLRRYFDYLPLAKSEIASLAAGVRIKIPFGKRELIGIFTGTTPNSSIAKNKLKPITAILDEEPVLASEIFQLCQWAADYYHYPIGEVLFQALPAWLRQGKPCLLPHLKPLPINLPTTVPLTLNTAQQKALSAIQASLSTFQVFLLDGITGSGKTEVYLQAIACVLAQNKQVLVLVPEIGLTPQTIQRFRERFAAPVLALNSAMTAKQRFQAWLQAKSGEAKIIIGTRSAVFTPFAQLGMIIVDEEHDVSFKQQEGLRYHARDLAIIRAHFNHIPIVLGSATPALETLHNAQQGRYQHLHLPLRAGAATLPHFQILDIRHGQLEQGLSVPLLNHMQHHLESGNQIMLFLNRRGFAPTLICPACGWMAICKRCDTRMTYHYQAARLHCHHCDTQRNLAAQCIDCGASDLQAIGQGTERLEKTLSHHFPHFSIARIDRDSTRRKGTMEKLLASIQQGEHQILIGTQMLAKGHHFPQVTLVAIVDADSGFFSADFRALERMGQLLLQVSGRAGRDKKAGTVILQTRHPEHPLLYQLVHQGYPEFSRTLLTERTQAELPPYVFFALFRAESHQLEYAKNFLQQVKENIDWAHSVQVIGPLAAPMPRRAGRYRVQLLLQAKQRSHLQQLLRNLMPRVEAIPLKQRVRWSLDIDPIEIF